MASAVSSYVNLVAQQVTSVVMVVEVEKPVVVTPKEKTKDNKFFAYFFFSVIFFDWFLRKVRNSLQRNSLEGSPHSLRKDAPKEVTPLVLTKEVRK